MQYILFRGALYRLANIPPKFQHIDFAPTQAAADEVAKGLRWRKKHKRGGTGIGLGTARSIEARKPLSLKTIKKMKIYFDRIEGKKKRSGWRQGEEGYPSSQRIGYALWSGDPGHQWVNGIIGKMMAVYKESK